MVKLTYCGGIPEIAKPGDLNVGVAAEHFEIKLGFAKKLEIPFQTIFDVAMKTQEQIENSATPLDFLLAGKMAHAIKTKEVTNYLVIDYDCGGGVKTSAVFKGVNVPVVLSTMQKQRVEYAKNNPQQAPAKEAAADPYAEIEKLHELKEKGILSEEEFNAKKAQLLGL